VLGSGTAQDERDALVQRQREQCAPLQVRRAADGPRGVG